jgi:hypothetical protein
MYKGNFTVDKKSMLVPTQINGIQVFAVVDSGAQVSIINKDLYNQIIDKPKIMETVFIKGGLAYILNPLVFNSLLGDGDLDLFL